jgi:hypothetical protein
VHQGAGNKNKEEDDSFMKDQSEISGDEKKEECKNQ